MNIKDLKHSSVLCWGSSDICEMTSQQQAFLDLAPEFIALLEATCEVRDWHEDDFRLVSVQDARDRLLKVLGML